MYHNAMPGTAGTIELCPKDGVALPGSDAGTGHGMSEMQENYISKQVALADELEGITSETSLFGTLIGSANSLEIDARELQGLIEVLNSWRARIDAIFNQPLTPELATAPELGPEPAAAAVPPLDDRHLCLVRLLGKSFGRSGQEGVL